MFKGTLETDNQGYILGEETIRTNVEGVFVAGRETQNIPPTDYSHE